MDKITDIKAKIYLKDDMMPLPRNVTSMNDKQESSLNVSWKNCCIYKVPRFILNGKEHYYQPLMISIGPEHYLYMKSEYEGNETMHKLKRTFIHCFFEHPDNNCRSLNSYTNFVKKRETEIRESYQHESKISNKDEFFQMIVVDAAFLVYLFMWMSETPSFTIPSIGNNLIAQINYSLKDLFKLENQIPYFVLKEIFHIAFGHKYRPITFINATLTFIGNSSSGIPGSKAVQSIIDGNKITDETSIKHLVDLQRMCCCLSKSTPLLDQPNQNLIACSDSYIHCQFGCVEVSLGNWQPLETHGQGFCHLSYTAKQLKDAGVTFLAGESGNPLDVTFANGILTISKLRILDSTETTLRNLVYFEQCHYIEDLYIIDYIIFLDRLIDTVEDVQVLVQNEILTNRLGSDDDAVKLFNNIGKNVFSCSSKFNYSNVCRDVNRYASTRRNQWMAILRSKYFNHPWAILSVIAAFMLFVLTLLQTTAAYIYK